MLPTFQSPLVSAVVRGNSISAAANIVAQLLSEYRNEQPLSVDLGKFSRFLIICVVMAPLNYCWQALLERTFPTELFVGKNPADDDSNNVISPPVHGEGEALLLNDNDLEEGSAQDLNPP